MNTVYADFQYSGLTLFFNHCLYFTLCLFYHLFDSGRMDTSIYNQLLQCNPRNLSADRIEAGKHNCFRCVVDNQINAGQGFKGTDITSFPSDDTPLHFIAGKLYDRNRRFGYMICSTFLNRIDHIFFRFLVSFLFGPMFHFLDHLGRFMLHIIFNNFQQIVLCLVGGQTRDSFQFLDTLLVQSGNLFLLLPHLLFPLRQISFFLLDRIGLLVDVLFLLLHAAFVPGNLGSAFLDLAIQFVLGTNGFLLHLQQSFPFLRFCSL